jgi:hypothetical protein
MGTGVGLYLDHDPVNATEAVPKQYLDNNYSTNTQGDARWVNVTGDTMTGPLGIADTSSSPLVILGNPVMPGIPPPAPSVRFIGAHNNDGMFLVDAFGNGGSGGGGFFMARSTGGDAGAPGAVAAGQRMGGLRFSGYGTTGYGTARAVIQAFAAETFTDAAQGVYFSFLTTAIGTATPLERLRLTDAGALLLQVGDPTQPLQAVPKQYLDNNYSTNAQGDARWVNVSGDTMTGQLNIANNNSALSFKDASGGDVRFIVGSDNHLGVYSTGSAGATNVVILDFYARNDSPLVTFSQSTTFSKDVTLWGTLTSNSSINLNNGVGNDPNDRSRGITLWGPTVGTGYGFAVTAYTLNYAVQGGSQSRHDFYSDTDLLFRVGGDQVQLYRPMILARDPIAAMEAVTLQYLTANTISAGGGDARWVNVTGDTMTGLLGIAAPDTPTTAQLVLNPTATGAVRLESKIRFYGSFDYAGDTTPRFAASIRGGFQGGAWGSEHLDIWVSNQTNDANTDANQSRVARFNLNGLTLANGLSVGGDSGLHNVFLDGNMGIIYRGLSGATQRWVGFGYNGALNLYIDGAYTSDLATTAWVDGAYLRLTGGNVTGHTTFSGANPQISLNSTTGDYRSLSFETNGLWRWHFTVTAGESTGNVGSDFTISRMGDNGSPIDAPLRIMRNSGRMYLQSGNDPMEILSPAGTGARYRSTINGLRTWSAGTWTDGSYSIGDESAAQLRLTIDTSGNTTLNGGLTVAARSTLNGIWLNNHVSNTATDLTGGIDMYGGSYGFSITGGTLNIIAGGAVWFYPAGTQIAAFNNVGLSFVSGTTVVLGRDPSAAMEAATKQYVDSRARLYTNVKDYGATGNGSTDDTTAIQNAVNVAGAHTVFFPAGTYRTTASIYLAAGVSVLGVGPASVIAVAATQWTFVLSFSTATDAHVEISHLTIAPTAANCVGVGATLANFVSIHDVTFAGTAANAINLDRCAWYAIEDCFVTSSMNYLGGPVICQDTTSANGSAIGGNGTITRVRFAPMTGSPYGQRDACIRLSSQPTTNVRECYCAWGAYGAGPVSFIIIENQCQGNIIAENIALGMDFGILIQPGAMANAVMPAYITVTQNAIDSFGSIACFVAGTASLQAESITIIDNYFTEPQSECTAAAISAGGTGYTVGNILTGPAVPAAQEGAQVLLQVTAVSGGVISGVSVYNRGLTQTPPANPVAFTGGSGSGARFNLTYSTAGYCMLLLYANNSSVKGNFCLGYGGNRYGAGIVVQSVLNIIISGNRCNSLNIGMYCLDANCANMIITHNNLYINNIDFGGPAPIFSILQDNIGVPWISGTPALPATGVEVTNLAPYPNEILITGGVVYGITVNGVGLQLTGGAQWTAPIILTLRPQHAIAVAYTSPPTWTWIPML